MLNIIGVNLLRLGVIHLKGFLFKFSKVVVRNCKMIEKNERFFIHKKFITGLK